MKENKIERIEYILCSMMLGLVPLHLYLSFINFIYGIDKGYGHSYPLRCYILIGLYLFTILAANIFIIYRRGFELLKELCRYWAFSCTILILVPLIQIIMPEGSLLGLIFLFFTPYLILYPLLDLFGAEGLTINLIIVGCFCLFNWVLCKYFTNAK